MSSRKIAEAADLGRDDGSLRSCYISRMFKTISDKVSLPDLEKEILSHWKNDRIFEKSIEARQNAPDYTFYEGPPTANGKPGIHHVFARTIKDLVCRYQTMRGFQVHRKAG